MHSRKSSKSSSIVLGWFFWCNARATEFCLVWCSIGITTSVCLPISVHASIPLYSFDYGFSVFTNWEFFKDFEHSSHQSKSFQTYSTTTGWNLCNALNKTDLICAVDYTKTDEYDWYVNDASWMSEWINMQLRATFLVKQKICEKGEVRQVISQWWWRDSIRVAMQLYGGCEFCRMLWQMVRRCEFFECTEHTLSWTILDITIVLLIEF